MNADTWLERWLPRFGEPSSQPAILELGCGECRDTVYLERKGYRLVAGDLSAQRLDVCAKRTDRAALLQLDLRSALPFARGSFSIILASLCLHYFTWADTVRAVQEIGRCLAGDGLLLCRLNSTNDVHYGATGHPAVDLPNEGHYYEVGSRRKRFFNEQAVRALFAQGWIVESLQEQTIFRYTRPKVVWEAVLRKTRIV